VGRVEARVRTVLLTAARITNVFWIVRPTEFISGLLKLWEGSMNRFWLIGAV
jgi:hypothetical protein